MTWRKHTCKDDERMTENKRFTCEVVDTGLFYIERITDTLENNTFSDVKTVTDLLNNFNEEVEQLKLEIQKLKNVSTN